MNFNDYRISAYGWLPKEWQKAIECHNQEVDKFQSDYHQLHYDREAKASEPISEDNAKGFMNIVNEFLEKEIALAGKEKAILQAQGDLASELRKVISTLHELRHTEHLKTVNVVQCTLSEFARIAEKCDQKIDAVQERVTGFKLGLLTADYV